MNDSKSIKRKQTLVANADWNLKMWDKEGTLLHETTIVDVPELLARRKTNEQIRWQNKVIIVARHELVPYRYYAARIKTYDGEHQYYKTVTATELGLDIDVAREHFQQWHIEDETYPGDYRAYELIWVKEIPKSHFDIISLYK